MMPTDLATTLGPLWRPALLGFATSLALCLLLVLTGRWHGRLTHDSTEGVQKLHAGAVPRVGGVPIVAGLMVAAGAAPEPAGPLLAVLLVAGIPAFVFGVAEDLTKRVGVLARLLATMTSGVVLWLVSGYRVTSVDVWGLDQLVAWLPLSVAFTAFAVGGVANAINIIDGLNGLAGTMATLALAGLGLIAHAVGDTPLALACFLTGAALLGFLCVNWPLGKIFLGDGGAYFVGFALASLAVLLGERNAHVSCFALLLVCVHPVSEVLFSIYRRKIRNRRPGSADCMHLHSLVARRWVRRWVPRARAQHRNSVAGILLGAMTLVPVLLAQWVHHSTVLSLVAVLACALGYVALYARMVRFRWCSPVAFLLGARVPAPAIHRF